MCGEGIPDFYAKQADSEEKYCVSYLVDKIMKPVWDKTGICKPMADYNFGVDQNGDPLVSDCQTVNFAAFYNSQESMNAFSALWHNVDGLNDKFVAYWNKTSERLSNNKYVVGYDPFNEPFMGNFLKEPELLVPGHFDKTYLAPLYSKLYDQYQINDPGSLMWFEPTPFPDEMGVLGGKVFPVGFEVPPGGEIGSPYHVLNDHTYCCQVSAFECSSGEPKTEDADKCLVWHNKRIGTRSEDAARLGLPLMISEFGACFSEGPCTQEIM